jgi:hypothetical protein
MAGSLRAVLSALVTLRSGRFFHVDWRRLLTGGALERLSLFLLATTCLLHVDRRPCLRL